jgi:hypothetical protein
MALRLLWPRSRYIAFLGKFLVRRSIFACVLRSNRDRILPHKKQVHSRRPLGCGPSPVLTASTVRRNPPMSKIRQAAPSFELIQVLVFGAVITLVGLITYLKV